MRNTRSGHHVPGRLLASLLAAVAAAALSGPVARAVPAQVDEQQLATLQLPPGFRINVFAEGLGYVRFLAFSPQGDLVATSSSREVAGPNCSGGVCVPNDGRVFVLPDRDGDGVADTVEVVVPNLPVGPGHWSRNIAFGPDGKLYVHVGS
jgi:glucose/arabinose dehydrogenase